MSFEEADANGDGVVDREEYARAHQIGAPQGAPQGGWSVAERKAVFEAMDRNHDGRVEQHEMLVAARKDPKVEGGDWGRGGPWA